MKVDLFIVGGQKCGTTALHEFLSMHPSIVGCQPKEPDYFCSESKMAKGEAFYHSFFKHKPAFSWLRNFHYLDASPTYAGRMVYERTAERILKYNPKAKIIFLLRNPVYRAYSAWNMYQSRYFAGYTDWWMKWNIDRLGGVPENVIRRTEEEFKDFDLYIRNELSALEQNIPIELPVLENGKYIFALAKYQSLFKSNFHVYSNEIMEKDTPDFLAKLCFELQLPVHDWSGLSNKKVFSGEYNSILKEETKRGLTAFYQSANDALYELTGIRY